MKAAGATSLLFVYSLDYARTRLANDAKNAKKGGERQFNGRVMRISPTTQSGSRSIPVYVEILDRDENLRGGLFGMGTINVKEKAHALAVPISAVRKDNDGEFVLAVENGLLVRKPVGVVRTWSRGELAEVKGLDAGMVVVAAPLPGLTAGQAVKLIQSR